MRSQSQAKVSAISFLIALLISLAVFGGIAYFLISGFMAPDEVEETSDPSEELPNEKGDEVVPLPPEEVEKINGESFTLLIAGYDVLGIGFDAMAVVDVNKEAQKISIYPINPDTRVYVGHGDSNSLNIRAGDLIKYKDMQYVLDKINATTGLKIEYYVTLTPEGFIEAFDAFNKNGDYAYKVPKDMEHLYYEKPEEVVEGEIPGAEAPAEQPATPSTPATPEPAGDTKRPLIDEETGLIDLEEFNISFKKGDTLTKGIDVYNMLRYKGDSSSERLTRQATFIRDVVAKIIPERFKEGNLGAVLDTVKALIKLTEAIETNVGVETFVSETFDLIAAMPNFSVSTVTKYTSGITNFK